MSLVALLTHLEQETRTRAETVRREAEERARQMLEGAEAELSRELERRVAERERVLAVASHGRLVEVRRETRQAVLAARERLLARIFSATEAALETVVDDEAYRARLEPELARALSFVPPPARVRCRPGLEAALGAAARGMGLSKKELAVVPDEGTGPGFVLEAADGSVSVDATLTARLARAWPTLSIDILRALEQP